MEKAEFRFGVLYDLRNPADPRWHRPWPEYLGGAIEHFAEVDSLGFHSIAFAEHHGDPDGYNPAIIGAMSVAATVTRNVEIGSNIIVLPQHHPVMLAEQLAFVDVLSNGRLRVGFGPGGPFDMEYRMLGINPKHRPSRLEEALEIIVRAWTEDEPFTYRGKRFEFEDVGINPKPVQKPHPPLFLAAPVAEAAMERARCVSGQAQADQVGGFFGVGDPAAWSWWRQSFSAVCERNGVDPASVFCSVFVSCFVTEDPEKAWAEHRESAFHVPMYERQGERPYAGAFALLDATEPEHLPGWQGLFCTPDQAVAAFRACYEGGGPDEIQLMAARPSMSWEQSLEHLSLFMDKVEPHLRDLPGLGGPHAGVVEALQHGGQP